MTAIFQLASGIIQILFLILKNKFEKDAEEKKRKEALHADAKEAIVSRNVDTVVDVLNRLRQK